MPYFLVVIIDGKTSAGFHGFHEDVVGVIDVGGHDMLKAATGCYWETAGLVGVDFFVRSVTLRKTWCVCSVIRSTGSSFVAAGFC